MVDDEPGGGHQQKRDRPGVTSVEAAQKAMSGPVDAMLLESLRSGHEAAFEALFRRYYERIRRVLYRLVGDESEDLTQDVFLRLYRRPPGSVDADLTSWLYRVATNLGYNAIRSRKRRESYRNALGAITGGRGWRQSDPDPEAHVERDEEQIRVRAVLAGLSRRQATILILRHGGLTYREIGGVMGVSTGSVGTLLARAERSFRSAYERQVSIEGRQGGES